MRSSPEDNVCPGGSLKAEGLGEGLLRGEGILPLFFGRDGRAVARQGQDGLATQGRDALATGRPSPSCA